MKLKIKYLLIAYITLAGSILMITSRNGYGSSIYLSVIFIVAPALSYFIRKHNKKIDPEKKDLLDEIEQETCLIFAIFSCIGFIISIIFTKYAWVYIILYVAFLYLILPRYAPLKEKKNDEQ